MATTDTFTRATADVASTNYTRIVEKVQAGHSEGLEALYGMAQNFTFFLMRQLGKDDIEDRIHDVFLTAAQAIASGKVRDPERLAAFITTIARFYTYGQIERRVQDRRVVRGVEDVNVPDNRVDLEEDFYGLQQEWIVEEVLSELPERDGEILRRFYLQHQSKEQICDEMNLTPTQFRLYKSQAKATFAKLGTRRLKAARWN